MDDKELYQQKKQAQLDEWKAEVDKLRAKASGASADAQLEMNKHIRALEHKIEEAKAKMAELAKSEAHAWDTIKDGVETAWDSLKSAVNDVATKFKS